MICLFLLLKMSKLIGLITGHVSRIDYDTPQPVWNAVYSPKIFLEKYCSLPCFRDYDGEHFMGGCQKH